MSNTDSTLSEASNTNSSLQPEPDGYRNRLILSLYGVFFVLVLALIGYAIVTQQGTVLAAWDTAAKKAINGSVQRLANLFKAKELIAEKNDRNSTSSSWGENEPTGTPSIAPSSAPTKVPVKSNQNRISVKTSGSSKVDIKVEAKTNSSNYSYRYQYPTPKPHFAEASRGRPGSSEWEADFQRNWNNMSAQNAQAQKDSEARHKEFDAQWQKMQSDREAFMKEWNVLNQQITKGN